MNLLAYGFGIWVTFICIGALVFYFLLMTNDGDKDMTT